MSEIALPNHGAVLASQIRYQLTLLASRAMMHGSGAIMSVHDLAVLAGWALGGLLVSFWFFQWDPHRPAHARPAETRTTLRSA